MTGDDDLAAALPDPPPPAPSRREAAIGEAMRRFDGRPASPPRAEPRSGAGWIRRPQVGALVTVGLVALVGLPATWMMASRQNEAYHQAQTRNPSTLVVPPAPSGADRVETAAVPRAVTAPPTPSRNASPPPPVVAPPRETAPPPVAEAARTSAPPAPPVSAPSVLAQSDAFAPEPAKPAAKAEMRYRAAPVTAALAPPPPPPPPPPPAMVMAAPVAPAPAADMDEVIVTGARRAGPRIGRGDWNACTVDDPSRNLALCRHLVNPSTPGPKGVAAAHIADGLTQAWNGDPDAAVADFDQAIAVAPHSSSAYINRSQAYARQGDDERALADADKAVRNAPGSAQAYYNRGLLLRRRGEIAKAQADEQRAVEIDPGYEAVVPQ